MQNRTVNSYNLTVKFGKTLERIQRKLYNVYRSVLIYRSMEYERTVNMPQLQFNLIRWTGQLPMMVSMQDTKK